MIFVNSMSDLFHAKVPIGFVRDVFSVMADTPQHTYQLLTKRTRRLRRLADRLEWPADLYDGSWLPRTSRFLTGSMISALFLRLFDSYPVSHCSVLWAVST